MLILQDKAFFSGNARERERSSRDRDRRYGSDQRSDKYARSGSQDRHRDQQFNDRYEWKEDRGRRAGSSGTDWSRRSAGAASASLFLVNFIELVDWPFTTLAQKNEKCTNQKDRFPIYLFQLYVKHIIQ